MTKIYIIDDEQLIREGIKKIIRENCQGCTIVGEASNGKTGFEETMMLKPDLAIVDVCLPIMGGLEYVSLIQKKITKMRFIIISGYANFKYAKESLTLGCRNYLLKPIKHEELIEAINKISEEIKNDSDKDKAVCETNEKIKELNHLKKNYFLQKILNRELKMIDQQKLDMLELGYLRSGFYLAVLNIDNFAVLNANSNINYDLGESLISILAGTVREVINRKPGVQGLVIETGEREVAIIIGLKSQKNVDEEIIVDLLRNIQVIIRKSFHVSTTIGYSDFCTDILEVAAAFEMARSAVKYRFTSGLGNIFKYCKNINKLYIYPYAEETKIIAGIESGNSEEVFNGLNCILNTFEQGAGDRDVYLGMISNLYLQVTQKLVSLNAQEILQLIPDFLNFKNRLDNIDTLNDLKIYLLDIFKIIISGFKGFTFDQKRKIIKTALEFLERNYSSNIGLNEVADYIGMNPSYFSILFKKQIGETFTDYFIKFRIEKAKSLLVRSNIKVHDVAQMVGYGDTKHFSKIFKRVVGITPFEYRERNGLA